MDNKTPYFSIVIPTYNRGHLVGKTLESILAQTFDAFEVIVVDDGSTDDTSSVMQKFKDPRVRYYKKQNGERGAARNYGAARSSGSYINFFDSDDLMYSNHLEVARKFIDERRYPELIHLGYDFKDVDGNIIRRVDNFREDLLEVVKFDNVLSCNGVFLRRDIWKDNQFNEEREMASTEDWELWIRLVARYQLHYLNVITSSVVDHDLRSIFTISPEKVVRRDLKMIERLEHDPAVLMLYQNEWKRFKALRFSFFMLCLAENGKKEETLKWAISALVLMPSILLTKRFLASIKKALWR